MQRLAATLTAGSVPDAGGGGGWPRRARVATTRRLPGSRDEVSVELAAGDQFTRL